MFRTELRSRMEREGEGPEFSNSLDRLIILTCNLKLYLHN